jgi:hypothetical protein
MLKGLRRKLLWLHTLVERNCRSLRSYATHCRRRTVSPNNTDHWLHLQVRPTSETLVNWCLSQWVTSYRDLPQRLNQVALQPVPVFVAGALSQHLSVSCAGCAVVQCSALGEKAKIAASKLRIFMARGAQRPRDSGVHRCVGAQGTESSKPPFRKRPRARRGRTSSCTRILPATSARLRLFLESKARARLSRGLRTLTASRCGNLLVGGFHHNLCHGHAGLGGGRARVAVRHQPQPRPEFRCSIALFACPVCLRNACGASRCS